MNAPAAELVRILVVEDEASIRETLRYNLEREGYAVSEVASGPAGLAAARSVHPDLIILDLMLPGMNGLEVCRTLRAEMTTPILMLTAKAAEIDTVVGLSVGADDYLAKPFSLNELIARVAALLRRARMSAAAQDGPSEVETWGSFVLDRAARRVQVDDTEVRLSPREFDLLSLLVDNPGRVMSRATIIQRAWGSAFYGDHKTVDVHVRWLREKFEEFPRMPFHISTVFGVGYRLDRDGDASRPS